MKTKQSAHSAFLTLCILLALFVFFAGILVALFGATDPHSFIHDYDVNTPRPNRSTVVPTFAERVTYQRAIEEIYWRHRLWPKESSHPKPSLDAVMSQGELEKKVADYLRKSQALEDYWQRPITAEQLQAELDRMATNTKQPEVLRELFAALDSDPFVIAECLARPVLTERLTADLSRQNRTKPLESAQVKGRPNVSAATTSRNISYTVPRISKGDPACADDTWTATSTTNAPLGRSGHSAVWTGSEVIIWGGLYTYYTLDTGGRYNPVNDSWTATSTGPAARYGHSAVWTGSEMIVWGGASVPVGGYLNTGGRYNPGTDSWTATSTSNAPTARSAPAVWTGSEMIVWGGYDGSELNTGGRYNPITDSWTATSPINAPDAREGHTAIWTGSEMIIWGGYLFDGSSHWLNTGSRYNPALDTWTASSTTNAPSGRRHHTAIWTGSEMVVWGGYDGNGDVNTGGRYDPSADTWTATSTTNAPTARDFHTAVWTNSEMIVWGGCTDCSYGSAAKYAAESGAAPTPTPSEPPPTATPTATATASPTPIPGGRYDPDSDSWTPTSTTNAPSDRDGHTAVWTGSEMIVWGGGLLNTGGRYCAQASATPTPTPTPTGCFVTSNACGSILVGTPPTDFIVNLSDGADPVTVQGSDFMVNGTPANTAVLLNGNTTITFHFNTSPAVQGQNTMHIPAGAFDCGNGGVQEFTCTFSFEVPRATPTPHLRPSPAPRP